MSTTSTAPEFDIQLWLEKYKGLYPQGVAGDQEIRSHLAVPFVDTTDEDVRKPHLSADEINSWLDYAGWNLWDFILGRASEGESGLIPRQEYETNAFIQQWNTYPKWINELTDTLGVQGVIDLGKTASNEVGTKVNVTRNWAASVCPILGRGIGIELGQDTPDGRREDLEGFIQFGRRLQHGTWGGGSGLASGRDYKLNVLSPEFLGTLVAQATSLEDPDKLEAFRKFNAKTELFGFMLHYDCRAGMGDTGPYELPDGRFAIVRDHFLNEDIYPWAGVAEGLPYSVTQVMIFPADKVKVTINDIMTTFSDPSNYLDYIESVAVLARDKRDTPMGELRVLTDAEMVKYAGIAQKGTLSMYRTLAAKSTEEKIRDGIMVYTREFLFPHAMKAGLWDKWVADGFDDLHPNTEAAWPTLASPQAAEILTPVLLFGRGFPPVSE